MEVKSIKVSFHSLDREGIQFFEDCGHPLTTKGKRFGWDGETSVVHLWTLAQLAFEKGLAVKIRKYEGTVILQLDSNKWHFRQH